MSSMAKKLDRALKDTSPVSKREVQIKRRLQDTRSTDSVSLREAELRYDSTLRPQPRSSRAKSVCKMAKGQ